MSEPTANELEASKKFALTMADPRKRQQAIELLFDLAVDSAKRGIHTYDLIMRVLTIRLLTEGQREAIRVIYRTSIENQILRSREQPPS